MLRFEVEARRRPPLVGLEVAAQLGLEPVPADLDDLEVVGVRLFRPAPGRAQVERAEWPHLLEHLAAPGRPVVRDHPVAQRLERLFGLELGEDPDRLLALDVHRHGGTRHLGVAQVPAVGIFRHAASRVSCGAP